MTPMRAIMVGPPCSGEQEQYFDRRLPLLDQLFGLR
jgi:hypothetical protein